ncbi:arsenate reductase ArsC [Candidatus Parvarchaeota archaeon]|nr:arsenate reductase ArsC [Candidatus Parvarchaeota archaeon]
MQPKKILFVCVGNAARSQMAQGFANHLGKGRVIAQSAGTHPASKISAQAVQTMAEVGIDISRQAPKRLTEKMAKNADLIITMGCGVEVGCPITCIKETVDWGLADPKGWDAERMRKIRHEIKAKVLELLETV